MTHNVSLILHMKRAERSEEGGKKDGKNNYHDGRSRCY